MCCLPTDIVEQIHISPFSARQHQQLLPAQGSKPYVKHIKE